MTRPRRRRAASSAIEERASREDSKAARRTRRFGLIGSVFVRAFMPRPPPLRAVKASTYPQKKLRRAQARRSSRSCHAVCANYFFFFFAFFAFFFAILPPPLSGGPRVPSLNSVSTTHPSSGNAPQSQEKSPGKTQLIVAPADRHTTGGDGLFGIAIPVLHARWGLWRPVWYLGRAWAGAGRRGITYRYRAREGADCQEGIYRAGRARGGRGQHAGIARETAEAARMAYTVSAEPGSARERVRRAVPNSVLPEEARALRGEPFDAASRTRHLQARGWEGAQGGSLDAYAAPLSRTGLAADPRTGRS